MTISLNQDFFVFFHNGNKYRKKDLAFSAHKYLAKGLAQIAVEHAQRQDVKIISLSGGVAYNELITSTIERAVEVEGIRFVRNRKVPTGDGGISLGQTAAVDLLD